MQDSKRQFIAARKAEELGAERGRLAAWQTALPGSPAPPPLARAAVGAPATSTAHGGGLTGAPQQTERAEDHAEYYGRGAWPSAAGGTLEASEDARAAAHGNDGGVSKPWSAGTAVCSGAARSGACETAPAAADPHGAGREAAHEEARAAARSEAPFKPPPPPRRAAVRPVPVEFTALQTRHLPARAGREAEICAYRRQQQVLCAPCAPTGARRRVRRWAGPGGYVWRS